MSAFKIGDPVWYYFGTTSPMEGVVTEVTDYGGIRVQTSATNHVHAQHTVYRRPDDAIKLGHDMSDDADHLQRCANNFIKKHTP